MSHLQAFEQGSYAPEVGGKKFNFLGLPFAGIEVANLAQTFSSTTIRQDKDFNLQLVPQMDSFSVVHLATHGAFVVGTPEQSFISFGDGTPVTLEAMKKWQFKNLEVNDGGTQALINTFYSALKKDKITKTEALRQAQIAMINSDRPANPSQRASIEIIQDGVPPEVASRLSHPFYPHW